MAHRAHLVRARSGGAARRRHVAGGVSATNGRGLHAQRLSQLSDWDAGSRQRTIVDLQHSAGNRAVAQVFAGRPATGASLTSASLRNISDMASSHAGLAVIPILLDFEAIGVSLRAARSAAAAPPTGAQRIRGEVGGSSRAAGYTALPAPTPPELTIGEAERREAGWAASVQPAANDRPAPPSLYPAAGVHELGTNAGGQPRHVDVTPEMSNLIRRGEEEHLLDLEWARHLSYDRAASAVNAAAESEPPVAASAGEARRLAAEQVRAALPAQLRWGHGADPVRPWIRAYSRMAHVTIERDQSRWHDMTSAFVLDPAEKRRLGVPEGDELTRYVGGPQIGQHPSAPLVRARFAELEGG